MLSSDNARYPRYCLIDHCQSMNYQQLISDVDAPANDAAQLLIIDRSSVTLTDKKVVVEVRRCRILVSPTHMELHHTCRVITLQCNKLYPIITSQRAAQKCLVSRV